MRNGGKLIHRLEVCCAKSSTTGKFDNIIILSVNSQKKICVISYCNCSNFEPPFSSKMFKGKVGRSARHIACPIFRNFFGSVLVYDFWTPPTPPPINFVHDLIFLLFRVRLRYFLGRALRLGWARGPSAAATGQVS